MSDQMKLKGRTALVTGAGSGIGRALAFVLAQRGCALAVADIDAASLAETAKTIGGTPVTQHVLDVADKDAVAALPPEIEAAHGRLDVLVNNAGVALGGTFEQVSEADFDWLLSINLHGVVRMTRAFLPLLHASDDARLVNISSIFGIVAPPGQTAYAASKFAVRGFSEALRHELKASRIGVTTVHPGGVATQIAARARVPQGTDATQAAREKRAFAARLTLPPEVAAETIVRGIERRQPRLIVGTDAKVAALLERLFPASHWDIISRLGGRSNKEKA